MLEILEDILDTIKVKPTGSLIFKAIGIEVSMQSFSVQVGIKLEEFWNKVAPKIDTSATDRQVDLFFEKNGVKYYFEMKCNTGLDSEKKRASNEKIAQVTKELGADVSGYFNPMVSENYYESKLKQEIWGVKKVLDLLDTPFSSEEYIKRLQAKLKEKASSC